MSFLSKQLVCDRQTTTVSNRNIIYTKQHNVVLTINILKKKKIVLMLRLCLVELFPSILLQHSTCRFFYYNRPIRYYVFQFSGLLSITFGSLTKHKIILFFS